MKSTLSETDTVRTGMASSVGLKLFRASKKPEINRQSVAKQRLRTVRPNARNISTQHGCAQRVTRVWPPCSNMSQDVARCWMVLDQVWKWSNFCCNIFGFCMMLYSFDQLLHNISKHDPKMLLDVACVWLGQTKCKSAQGVTYTLPLEQDQGDAGQFLGKLKV